MAEQEDILGKKVVKTANTEPVYNLCVRSADMPAGIFEIIDGVKFRTC